MREETPNLPFFEMSASPESLVPPENLESNHAGSALKKRPPVRTYACALLCVALTSAVTIALWRAGLDSVFGAIDVDTAEYEMVKQADGYQVRRYASSTAIATSNAHGDRGQFMRLAGFIGVTGPAQNSEGRKIAMTAPVVTFKGSKGDEMQFILPRDVNDNAPQPTSRSVRLVERPVAVYGVETFSGSWNDHQAEDRANALAVKLKADGYTVKEGAPFQYMRYNPPWTLPMFRTNEVAVQIEDGKLKQHDS